MSALLRSSLSSLTINCRGGLLNHTLRDLPARVSSCNLYNESRLKVDQFKAVQAKVSSDFGSIRDQFMARVKQNLESDSKVIFTEDVKNVIYLASKDDLELLAPLLSKYVKQSSSEFTTRPFQLGPLVCRLLYAHRQADLAYMLMTDPQLASAFNTLSSYTVACDLLLEEDRPQEAVNLIEQYMEKTDKKYPSDLTLLYAQACYKIGTEESYAKLKAYITSLLSIYAAIPARVFSFHALLSLKFGHAAEAYELASKARDRSLVAVNAIVRLQVELGLYEEALARIKSFAVNRRVPFMSQGLYDDLSTAVNSKGSQELKDQLMSVNDLLVSQNLMDPKSFEEMANMKITVDRDRVLRDQPGRPERSEGRPFDRPGGRYEPRDARDRNYNPRGYDNRSYDERSYNRSGYDGPGYRQSTRQYSRPREDDQYSRDYQ